MSAVVDHGSSGGRGGQSQDFELNLASIIDCFTVLIAFMLVSASFVSIGIIDAGVAAAGTTAKETTPPSVNVAVELTKDKIVLRVTGKQTATIPIASKGTDRDYELLTQNLSSIKGKWQDLSAVTLTADESVAYNDVVKTMEVVRKSIPVVMLGGF